MLPNTLTNQERISPTEALLRAVRDIPEGQVTATAARAGIKVTQLSRLRRGEQLNIQIETLAKLAYGMRKSADELIGLAQPDPREAIEAVVRVSADAEKKLRKKFARIAAEMALLASNPREGGAPKKAKP